MVRKERVYPYGLYVGSGIFKCADCGREIVFYSNRPLPTCPNYTNESHKRSFWIQVDFDEMPSGRHFAPAPDLFNENL